jgi:hypothetical protein
MKREEKTGSIGRAAGKAALPCERKFADSAV